MTLLAEWPPGSMGMASVIRTFCWADTSLGPMSEWSPVLRAAVGTCLLSPEPEALLWGDALVQLHNDAFVWTANGTPLGRLGQAGAEGWATLWDSVGPPICATLADGKSSLIRGTLLSDADRPAFDASCTPVADATGAVAGVRLVLRDRSLVAWGEEYRHRVRNMLAVTRSIIRRSARTADTVEDYAMHLDGRLGVLARVEAMVTLDPGAGLDLEFLIGEEMTAQSVQENSRLTIQGGVVRLRGRTAELMAFAVHELATNAVKFGSLGPAGGRLAVTWAVDPGTGALRFRWQEDGTPQILARGPGFGTELLARVLPYELGAKTGITLTGTGLQCTIDLPLTAQIEAQSVNGQSSDVQDDNSRGKDG